ncbi:hypothetical protein OOT46_30270 [Aquabacterium sp. A7-Y]|uniref:hypothetical protein n=1 Tax=Aquabacterium sp. A7-Y TaxID=1349605 RepID=UPI00223DA702|nr:hypothetical protein [Aquabacterium sp. A7-Y]MCW7542084.1 hypothetical protein [Aquabacterium sp. A7-Y]
MITNFRLCSDEEMALAGLLKRPCRSVFATGDIWAELYSDDQTFILNHGIHVRNDSSAAFLCVGHEECEGDRELFRLAAYSRDDYPSAFDEGAVAAARTKLPGIAASVFEGQVSAWLVSIQEHEADKGNLSLSVIDAALLLKAKDGAQALLSVHKMPFHLSLTTHPERINNYLSRGHAIRNIS